MDIFSNYELDLDLCSSGLHTVAPNSQSNIEYSVDRLGYMTGLEYFRYGGNPEDTATFQIIENGVVVLELAKDVLMVSGHHRYEAYKAVISSGMTLRLVYKNNGSQSAQFGFNVIRHRPRSA